MQKITIRLNSSKSDAEIWKWLKENLQRNLEKKVPLEMIKPFFDDEKRKVDLKGRTVSGSAQINNGAIEIILEIPLLYRFFAPHIKSAVKKIFDQI